MNKIERKYDRNKKCLVYHGNKIDANYWDKHWNEYTIERVYPKYLSKYDYVISTTKKYIPPNAVILEGGCGVGQQVYKLQKTGYNAVGIDYAKETIDFVKKHKPELKIQYGDVRALDFENDYFDAYWSFGVIEHFYDGYKEVALEMKRVIKDEGYLFLTFPHMSLIRRVKACFNMYSNWETEFENEFYQFALNSKEVITYLQSIGFKLVQTKHLDGAKGFKDEVVFLKPLLQKIYDSSSLPIKIINKIFSIIFSKFASHSILLVLKKEKNVSQNTPKN